MKKVLLLIVCLVFLTGCDIDYELTIDDNSFSEDTKIFTDINMYEEYDGSLLSNYFDNFLDFSEPIYFNDENYDYYSGGNQPNVRYYNINNYVDNNYKGLEFQNVFGFNDYYRSSMVKECFDELNVQNNNGIYLIRTSNKCKVFSSYSLLNQIKITINTDIEVIFNNADYVNGNSYTWIINRDNYMNKSVRLSLNTNKDDLSNFNGNKNDDNKDNNTDKNDNKNSDNDNISNNENKDNNNVIIIAVVLFIFCGGLFIIILLKNILNK